MGWKGRRRGRQKVAGNFCLPFRRPAVANFVARHSNLAPRNDRVVDCVRVSPFWSHPDVLEFTLKGYSARESPSARRTRETEKERGRRERGEGRGRIYGAKGKGIERGEGRSEIAGAQALYDDGGFARKSQCSATSSARIRC